MERGWGRWELEDGKSLGEGEGSRRWRQGARWSWPWWGSRQALADCREMRGRAGAGRWGSPWGRSAGGDLEGLVEAGARLRIMRKLAPVPRILGLQVWAPSTQSSRA